MNLVIIRTLILYTTVVVFLRIMGKRQIGQLQPYELVVIIMISELAAIPMQNTGIPIINGLIPIFILFAAEEVLSYIALKSERARGVICGKPSILIANSRINEEEMRRLRYNINELLEQLRLKDVTNICDVEYAILETGGQLSVILKSQKRPVEPADLGVATGYEGLSTTLVIDGHVIHENLKQVFLNLDWLKAELDKDGVTRFSDVFFASVNPQGELFYQLKQS